MKPKRKKAGRPAAKRRHRTYVGHEEDVGWSFYADLLRPGWARVEVDMEIVGPQPPMIATGEDAKFLLYQWACYLVMNRAAHLGWWDAVDMLHEFASEIYQQPSPDRSLN